MKFCAQCLHQLNTAAKFCYHCGAEIEENQQDISEIRQQVGVREIGNPNQQEKRQGGSRLIGETVKKTDVVLELMEMVGAQKIEGENLSERWEEKLLGEDRPRRIKNIEQSDTDRKLKYDVSPSTSETDFSASRLLQEELSKLDRAVAKSNLQELTSRLETTDMQSTQTPPQSRLMKEPRKPSSRLLEGGDLQENIAKPEDYLKKLEEMLRENQETKTSNNTPQVVAPPSITPKQEKLPSYLEEFMATGRIPKLTDEMLRELQNPPNQHPKAPETVMPSQRPQPPLESSYEQTQAPSKSEVNPLTQVNAVPQNYVPTAKSENQGHISPYLAEFMATGRIPQLSEEMLQQVTALQQQQIPHPTQMLQTSQITENQVKLPSYLEEFMATGRIPQVTEEMLREIQQSQPSQIQSPQIQMPQMQLPQTQAPAFSTIQQPQQGMQVVSNQNQVSVFETVQAEEELIQEKNAKALEALQTLMNSIGMEKTATPPQEVEKVPVEPAYENTVPFQNTQQVPQNAVPFQKIPQTPQIPQNTPLPPADSPLISGETAKLLGVMDTLHQITADTAPIPQIEKSPPVPKVEILSTPKTEEKPQLISENMERTQLSDCLKLCYEAILALAVAHEELIKSKSRVKEQKEKVDQWYEKVADYDDVTFLQKSMVAVGFFALFAFAFWFLGMLGFLMLKMTPILDEVPISEFSIWTGVCVVLSSISVFMLMNRRSKLHQEDLNELESAKKNVIAAQRVVEDAYASIRSITMEENTKFMMEFLPEPYASIDAVSSFITYLENRRADTLKEAMNIYESEKQSQKLQELQQINLEAITGANKIKSEDEDALDENAAPLPEEKVDLEKTAQWKKETARRQARLNQNSQRISKQVRYANAFTVIDLGRERR